MAGASGQPTTGTLLCLGIETGSDAAEVGLWFSIDCQKPLPYICKVPATADKKADAFLDYIANMVEKKQ